ncbi:MAG: hypothetical protein M3R04_09810 [bacterium]|nr:hypothetical protein [bacterium]
MRTGDSVMTFRSATVGMACITAMLLTACPRTYPEGLDPSVKEKGSHAWDSPGYQGPELQILENARQLAPPVEQAAGGGLMEARPEKGPALPEVDTLDIEKIIGWWLVTGVTANEQLELLPVSEQDTFIFQDGGSVIYHSVANWKDDVKQGSYRKLSAGVLGLKIGGAKFTEFYGQLFEDDFLYIWNYENKTGFWMARVPDNVTERIMSNSFDTERGQLTLNDVVATSYSGKVVNGERTMTVSGFYSRGVLSMRWEEDDRTGTGYAMFIAPADWKSLKGAWWIDDYEAVPFSGTWNGAAN